MTEQEAQKAAFEKYSADLNGTLGAGNFEDHKRGWSDAIEWVKNGQEPVWLYHCGFNHLHSIITKKAAFVASSVVEGEEVTEGMRLAVINLSLYAVEMSRLFAKNPLYLHPTPQPDVTELVEAAKKALEALEWNWGGEPMPSLEFEAMGFIKEALYKLERKQTSAEIQGR